MGQGAPYIYDYTLLGQEALKKAAAALARTIVENKTCMIVVDVDDDGYTSSALLINYLEHFFPAWVNNKVYPYIH